MSFRKNNRPFYGPGARVSLWVCHGAVFLVAIMLGCSGEEKKPAPWHKMVLQEGIGTRDCVPARQDPAGIQFKVKRQNGFCIDRPPNKKFPRGQALICFLPARDITIDGRNYLRQYVAWGKNPGECQIARDRLMQAIIKLELMGPSPAVKRRIEESFGAQKDW